jgi:hypothetical protein
VERENCILECCSPDCYRVVYGGDSVLLHPQCSETGSSFTPGCLLTNEGQPPGLPPYMRSCKASSCSSWPGLGALSAWRVVERHVVVSEN